MHIPCDGTFFFSLDGKIFPRYFLSECDAFNASFHFLRVCLSTFEVSPQIFYLKDSPMSVLTGQFSFRFFTSCRSVFFAPFDCSSNSHNESKWNKLHFNTLKQDCLTILFSLFSQFFVSVYCFSWLFKVVLLYVNRQNMWHFCNSKIPFIEIFSKKNIFGRQVADFWFNSFCSFAKMPWSICFYVKRFVIHLFCSIENIIFMKYKIYLELNCIGNKM